MKRGGDFDGGFPSRTDNKRSRGMDAHKEELRVLIPSKAAGSIIGKGGENIKRMRSEYDAAVNVPDSNTPERIFTIATANRDNMMACLKDALDRLEADRPPARGGSDDGGRGMEIRLLVHSSHAGAIIGRAGFKIKEIREQSGSQVKMFTECAPASTERVCLLSGGAQQIYSAVDAIRQTLDEIPVKGQNRLYDTLNYDGAFAAEYGGVVDERFRGPPGGGGGGRGGGGGGFRGGGGGGDGGFDRGYAGYGGGGGYEDDYGRGPAVRGGGPARPGGVRGGGAMGMYGGGGGGGYGDDRYGGDGGDWNRGGGRGGGGGYGEGPATRRGGYAGGGGGGGLGGGGGMGYSAGPPPAAGGPVETTQVTIPDELGGTVIGRGGERINQIRQDSGAQITMDAANERQERIITITGTSTQIAMAQELLQNCVRASRAGRRYIEEQQRR